MADVPHPGAPPRRRRGIYIGSVILLIALLVIGIALFEVTKASAESAEKAKLLHQRLREAGLPAPAVPILEQTFGRDGGQTCRDPAGALKDGEGLVNGAAGPGRRPVIATKDLIQGEILVIATYCPDKLAAFTKQVRHLKLEDPR